MRAHAAATGKRRGCGKADADGDAENGEVFHAEVSLERIITRAFERRSVVKRILLSGWPRGCRHDGSAGDPRTASSAWVNVLWGLFNLVVAYLLVCRVGSFDLRKTQHVLVLGAGFLIMSLLLARTFGPLHGGS